MTVLTDSVDRFRRVAEAHRQAATDAERQARRYEQGERGEARVREFLAALEPEGWTVLHHRHWHATRGADLDHVLIGVDEYLVGDGQADPDTAQRERRELFVAMTRARDGLWTCAVAPAEEPDDG